MKPTVRDSIRKEIDLPTPTACWVLGAHLIALLSALPLVWSLQQHRVGFANASLLFLGAGVYIAAVAFECGQNTLDRWYLTNADEGFCDGLFYTLMIASFSLMAMGALGAPWVWALAVVVAVAHPIFYLAGSWVRFPLLSLALVLVDYAVYRALDAPIAFVHTLATFAGLYFLALLMRTKAQVFHGCAAVCFGLSMLAFPIAIEEHAQGTPTTWLTIGIGTAGLTLLLGILWPWLAKAHATPRQQQPRTAPRDAQLTA